MQILNSRAVKLLFGKASLVQVYFEAVANAFDAGADRIEIEIEADRLVDSPTVRLTIRDNGEGFTDLHFDRFARLIEPKDAQHKGLGRLAFLKYFSRVHVESVYNGGRRCFTFSESFEGDSQNFESEDKSYGTTLRFELFKGDRIHEQDYLSPGRLKAKLIEQFFPLLHERKQANRPFSIKVTFSPKGDQTELLADTQYLTSADIPDLEKYEFTEPSLDMFEPIIVWYKVEPQPTARIQFTAASVDGRTIPMNLFKTASLPPECAAVFIFEWKLFAGGADNSRQRLVLPDAVPEAALHKVLRKVVSGLLNEAIPSIAERNHAASLCFEERFPHLIGLFDQVEVGLIDRDDAIAAAQARFFQQQRKVLLADRSDPIDFEKTLEISARSLAEYILYRDLIIERLKQTSSEQLEDAIHELVVPRYRTFDQDSLVAQLYRNNAWLLDDKFMTFRTILSEARMDQLIAAITLGERVVEDPTRPDISMIFSADPDSAEPVDVVVVELKRRRVDDKDGPYAGTQLAKRAQKLVEHCANIQRVWYYGIIEIDDELAKTLRVMNWIPLFSNGKVFYQEFKAERPNGDRVPTPTFLVSYDAVADDASARNHSFLELLRQSFRDGAARSSTGEG